MIEPVTVNNLDEMLPLIRSYQEFYKVDNISDQDNHDFFSQFGEGTDKGSLFTYRAGTQAKVKTIHDGNHDHDEPLVAFATVYFSFASTIISRVAIMNDLYTLPEYRGRGVGRELIEYCWAYSQKHAAARLQWVTAPDNKAAQALYQSMGAKQTSWEFFTYTGS